MPRRKNSSPLLKHLFCLFENTPYEHFDFTKGSSSLQPSRRANQISKLYLPNLSRSDAMIWDSKSKNKFLKFGLDLGSRMPMEDWDRINMWTLDPPIIRNYQPWKMKNLSLRFLLSYSRMEVIIQICISHCKKAYYDKRRIKWWRCGVFSLYIYW